MELVFSNNKQKFEKTRHKKSDKLVSDLQNVLKSIIIETKNNKKQKIFEKGVPKKYEKKPIKNSGTGWPYAPLDGV